MELNTKKLFTPKIKYILKREQKNNNKTKYSFQNSKSKCKFKSSNPSHKLIKKTITSNINPFNRTIKINEGLIKKKFHRNSIINNNQKQYIKLIKSNDLFNDSNTNILPLTAESDSIKYEQVNEEKDNKENKYLNINKHNFNDLYKLFKKSVLKSTIIIDNNGNNNLNLEQKKFIDKYINKRTHRIKKLKNMKHFKINSIPIQTYKENNILFRNEIIKNPNNIKKDNTNYKQTISHNNLKYNFNIENIFKKNDKENSLFEVCTNNSLDSSFLGSCINDGFYKEFINCKN